jgi:LDH2 family malate/lactate/ureidoglycolate dehydrogenase
MPLVETAYAGALVAATFRTAGAPPDIARLVADSLIDSELAGHESHPTA